MHGLSKLMTRTSSTVVWTDSQQVFSTITSDFTFYILQSGDCRTVVWMITGGPIRNTVAFSNLHFCFKDSHGQKADMGHPAKQRLFSS